MTDHDRERRRYALRVFSILDHVTSHTRTKRLLLECRTCHHQRTWEVPGGESRMRMLMKAFRTRGIMGFCWFCDPDVRLTRAEIALLRSPPHS